MKRVAYLLWLLPLGACENKKDVAPQVPTDFATPADAKAFFYDLDAQQMRAMVGRDSAFFARHYATTYYNCTPYGELNDKATEIQTLLRGPWVTVEAIAPQFDVFAHSGDQALLTNTKRIKIRTPAGESFIYVRRTIGFQKIDGRWQGISGQGTLVQTRYVGQ
ncbi:nuclear transport factor 2 family protein [Hymenobacter sp.]|uniref:nuclear transport factor 2 family protein n=1 Tax=Hymenobacter sp. TaxID=1898978 RepID=UPI00286B615F|nr:nuclear transport factor 2 family protein [Hymenobacter sp.]